MNIIGKKIHDRRKELGLTLEEVGNLVGVGKSTVRKWETGDIENMRRDKIALLARALRVPPAFLLGWYDGERTELTENEKSSLEKELSEILDKNPLFKQLFGELLKLSDSGLEAALANARLLLEVQEKKK